MYYVVYTLYDDIYYYCHTKFELLQLCNLRSFEIEYLFNKSKQDYICVVIDNILYKVYRFVDEEK